MFGFLPMSRARDAKAKLGALGASQAMIEFTPDGTILTANARFLTAMGYTLAEIQGHHHSMLVDPAYKASPEYARFWEALRRGEFQAAEFKRLGKGGREGWLYASYNPVPGRNGKPCCVLKVATDVTASKLQKADLEGQITAIGKSQAVIEFKMDGTVITANQNFLAALGYTLDDIRGRHHSMFVEPAFRDSSEYRKFWESLRNGEYQAAEYKRLGGTARRSGSRPGTTRSSTRTGGRSRWSNTRPTSPARCRTG